MWEMVANALFCGFDITYRASRQLTDKHFRKVEIADSQDGEERRKEACSIAVARIAQVEELKARPGRSLSSPPAVRDGEVMEVA